jgi:hypothetical protein
MEKQTTTRRVPLREFVTLPEVARARGVTRVAVLYAIRDGRLRGYRVPGKRDWFVRRVDAEEFAAAGRKAS